MNKSRTILYLILITFCGACVEEIPLGNPSEFPQELVVEGSINDFDDKFRVSLQTTSSLRGLGVNVLGTGATVRIISDTETTQLNEIQPGIYETVSGALSVATGRSYYLDIVLSNDQHYQSTPVSLPEPMLVTSAFATPVNTSRVDELGVFRRSWAHAITVEFENSPNPQYFKTDMTGWREKYVSYTSETILFPTRCWAFENPATRGVTIGTNLEVESGNYLALTGAIRADGKERYIAEIKTSSLSEEAYLFWLEARTQLDRDKGVFVEPFAAVNGNLRNVNDDNEVVHGYFHAYSQQLIRTCFESFDLPLGNPVSVLGVPCADFFAPAEYELPFQEELCGE